jgi:hypothetical protein
MSRARCCAGGDAADIADKQARYDASVAARDSITAVLDYSKQPSFEVGTMGFWMATGEHPCGAGYPVRLPARYDTAALAATPPSYPVEYRQLMVQCVAFDPRDRPDIRDVAARLREMRSAAWMSVGDVLAVSRRLVRAIGDGLAQQPVASDAGFFPSPCWHALVAYYPESVTFVADVPCELCRSSEMLRTETPSLAQNDSRGSWYVVFPSLPSSLPSSMLSSRPSHPFRVVLSTTHLLSCSVLHFLHRLVAFLHTRLLERLRSAVPTTRRVDFALNS